TWTIKHDAWMTKDSPSAVIGVEDCYPEEHRRCARCVEFAMKKSLLFLSGAAALVMAAGAHAQTTPATSLSVLPPPGIDDPGATPVAPATSATPASNASSAMPASASTAIPIPPLPGMHEAAPKD